MRASTCSPPRRRGVRRVADRSRRRPSARDGGRHTDRHRPLPGSGAHRPRQWPDRRVDLWWSGKHAAHGGHVQVIAAPDGWPLWASPVRPGREHDTTALRAHAEALPLLAEWTDGEHAALADLGYEGERAALTTPIKKT